MTNREFLTVLEMRIEAQASAYLATTRAKLVNEWGAKEVIDFDECAAEYRAAFVAGAWAAVELITDLGAEEMEGEQGQ